MNFARCTLYVVLCTLYSFTFILFFPRLPAARQLAFFPMLGLWAVLVALFILVATFSGYGFSSGGRSFVATLLTFALLVLIMLLFAAKDFPERISALAGPGSAWLL